MKMAQESLLAPRRIFAEVRNDLVILVEERDARAQVGHKHDLAAGVDVRGENEAVERPSALAY